MQAAIISSPVNHEIAHQAWILVRTRRVQQKIRVQSKHPPGCRRRSTVVALDTTAGHNAVGILVQRVLKQELQLANLVAGRFHTAEILQKEFSASICRLFSLNAMLTSRLMYIFTPSGRPGGPNG